MNTTITLDLSDVKTLSEENKIRLERGERYLINNPHLGTDDDFYQKVYAPVAWDGYMADSTNNRMDIDPLVINTHGVNPFPDNQGTLQFPCPGDKLLKALETTRFHNGGYLHFLVPGWTHNNGFDYGVNFCNAGFKAVSDPDITVNKADIRPDEMYFVTCEGGWNYVFIRKFHVKPATVKE